MARLAALHRELERGAIDQEEFERREEIVLTRPERLREQLPAGETSACWPRWCSPWSNCCASSPSGRRCAASTPVT
ncbi:gas vesicle protein GvpG [Streptomyces sp. PT12]|uniref:gas vesicle protein GvpG n=1 Tax=Streptomyces sp. PT12 TaxID=1510197 RepID=UPI00215BB1E1|nr:gas vesicle protein GvpG [Streptomyces sp. PT12]